MCSSMKDWSRDARSRARTAVASAGMRGSKDSVEAVVQGDTQNVRPGEQLDWAALAGYLRWHLDPGGVKGLDLSADMTVSQFPGGHSNLTYLVRFGGADLVLRRPPPG